jgi:hypothetical protein
VNFELKKLSKDALDAASKKAQHYRLLNEPREAESICRDILAVQPAHHEALITLVLALTDQFGTETAQKAAEAQKLLEQLPQEYERMYYSGLVCERRATAYLESQTPGSGGWAFDWFRRAMDLYESAEAMRPAGNDDALLRWNTCARIIMHDRLEAVAEPMAEAVLE